MTTALAARDLTLAHVSAIVVDSGDRIVILTCYWSNQIVMSQVDGQTLEMNGNAVEQCDTPDQIVLHPKTEYVRKFTEDIDKARVVHAGVLAQAEATGEGAPQDATATVHDMARMLVNDTRDLIPVQRDGSVIGAMPRKDALDILLGPGA